MPRRRGYIAAGKSKIVYLQRKAPALATVQDPGEVAAVQDRGEVAAVQDRRENAAVKENSLQESGLARRLQLLPARTAHVEEVRDHKCLVTHAQLQALLETDKTCEDCGGPNSVSIDTVCLEPTIIVTCDVCDIIAYAPPEKFKILHSKE